MKLDKFKLQKLIKETVKECLKENASKEAYETYKELAGKYGRLVSVLHYVPREQYKSLVSILKNSKDYDEFFEKAGPGEYDRNEFRFKQKNEFNLNPNISYLFFNNKDFFISNSYNDIKKIKEQLDTFKKRFDIVPATDETDRMYGRKRVKVVDKETGNVVDTLVNKKGSLGGT